MQACCWLGPLLAFLVLVAAAGWGRRCAVSFAFVVLCLLVLSRSPARADHSLPIAEEKTRLVKVGTARLAGFFDPLQKLIALKDDDAEMAMDVCKKYYEWANSEELTGNADKATGEVYAEKLDALVNEY